MFVVLGRRFVLISGASALRKWSSRLDAVQILCTVTFWGFDCSKMPRKPPKSAENSFKTLQKPSNNPPGGPPNPQEGHPNTTKTAPRTSKWPTRPPSLPTRLRGKPEDPSKCLPGPSKKVPKTLKVFPRPPKMA